VGYFRRMDLAAVRSGSFHHEREFIIRSGWTHFDGQRTGAGGIPSRPSGRSCPAVRRAAICGTGKRAVREYTSLRERRHECRVDTPRERGRRRWTGESCRGWRRSRKNRQRSSMGAIGRLRAFSEGEARNADGVVWPVGAARLCCSGGVVPGAEDITACTALRPSGSTSRRAYRLCEQVRRYPRRDRTWRMDARPPDAAKSLGIFHRMTLISGRR